MKTILGKYNTLRNQILIVYLIAMVIVLIFVSVTTYTVVFNLIKDKAETQMQQTALEATGRMESLYQQIDTLSVQISTDSKLQQLLLNDVKGLTLSFSEKQSLMRNIDKLLIYSTGITAVELYGKDFEKLVPLDDVALSNRLKPEWIERANIENGGLVWIGRDPNDPNFFLAMRSVNLIDLSFSIGGYLLIQINPNHFQMMNTDGQTQSEGYMVLLDTSNDPITSNYSGGLDKFFTDEKIITINESEYMFVKEKSKQTGWTLGIISPVENLMEGVSVLRLATFITWVFGLVLFIIFSCLFSTMVTRPINKLTKAMKYRSKGALIFNSEDASTNEIIELNKTYNEMVEEINHLIQVVFEKELLRSKTELKALQSQINPHFLFNTLNAMYWSLDDKGEEELAELVLAMSDLFRYTIDNNINDEWVTIEQELSHVEKYMQIMKFRIDRITWKIEVPNEYLNVKIPKLLIQPLVENAIIHGISNKLGEGNVTISIKRSKKENWIICEVLDDGKGMKQEILTKVSNLLKTSESSNIKTNGIGIVNVNKRLQLYYHSNKQMLEINSEKNKGTSCLFEVPVNGGESSCIKQS